ncbi:MAG TPA: EAL domain-containing protein [Solirubrobacteraceae bacterium]|nr:EAL domain-containing protein [Solirubrobacteraceae bacterium]
MTPPRPQPAQTPGPDELVTAPDAAEEAIRRLGEALRDRIEDVSERTKARSQASGQQLDPTTAERVAQIGRASTKALADWMAGGSPERGRETGRQAFETYGQLAAQRLAPLNEIAKRCLRWRDAVKEVLAEIAAELGLGEEVALRAGTMVQKTIDVTLVRMCECFEIERHGADEELDRRQQELSFMATHDSLTGLPNRALIIDRTEQALARARRNKTPLAALFVDVDNFKSINDLLGHEAGDEVLRAVAARLDGMVRSTDALGRLGGDEFVVIAEALSLEAGPELVADRVLEALGEPIRVSTDRNTSLTVTASVGVAVGERSSAEELLRDADIAMYRAKWGGKNRYVLFESGMEEAQRSRTTLEMDLRDAVRNEEFFLVYQPTFDLREMDPTGVEALLRWRHPTRGVVQPNDFIPLLEETGLVVEVGRWVLQEACRQCAAWRSGGQEIGLAVNVSGRQLDTDDFIDDVVHALAASALDPEALTLEITETTLMRNVEETARRLLCVKELGVKIAIDDFGTGYSSLAHLQRFPVDALKIDRSFISRLTQNPEGAALLHTLVQLGKALALETLAEGIENPEELSMLRNELCDSGQGFLFARPLEVAATEAFLRNWEATKAAQWSADPTA